MFATLLGALPSPTEPTGSPADADVEALVELAVRAQEAAGLEPITDGRLRDAGGQERPAIAETAVRDWRATQALTDRAVKQVLPGPFASGAPWEAVADAITALAAAGCPLVEVEESMTGRLAEDAARTRFARVHEAILGRAAGTHLSLSITGGAPPDDAWPMILALPYGSLAVDLIAGPDSWNLVTRWPGERGVIAGVESAARADEPKEVLLWAAHYAASARGRGLARVGLGSAGSWADLTWEAAVRKLGLLGEAARLATMAPGRDLAQSVDPRSISARHAALGHDASRRDV